MTPYFRILEYYSESALKLCLDYSFADVEDPHVINQTCPTPAGFLQRFQYKIVDGHPEDLLANGIGWLICSPRVAEAIRQYCPQSEVELLPLPAEKCANEKIRGYQVLGVKKRIECVDYERSEILWSQLNPSAKHILSFRKCVIRKQAVPPDVHCFLLAEYPVFPVLSASLAERLGHIRPSGIAFEAIETA